MLAPALVLAASAAYLLLLCLVAAWGDARARQGRSVVGHAGVYTLSLAVYCTAWTYYGSVGRAASAGMAFLPVYLGPMLAMVLAWLVVRKMIRIARSYRISSIADFIASRYGHSPLLAGLVTLVTLVGIVPYIALQLKAVATGHALLTQPGGTAAAPLSPWWRDGTLAVALALAGFTMVFGTRQPGSAERHEGMVLAIAVESLVKLLAFVAVGVFVTWGLFGGPADLFARALQQPALARLLTLGPSQPLAYGQWLALTVLSALSVLFLPRQFQVMVLENVDERHLRRAAWAFPAYLLLINLFVLPIALGGLMHFAGAGQPQASPDGFVLSLPLAAGQPALALLAFVGGLSAATGMVIVEATAVSTMVCNDLVLPLLLRSRRWAHAADLSGWLLAIRRAAIVALLLLGWLYMRLAGEAQALVSIGLISFAAVAQCAPALLGGMYWRGATRGGALAGLAAGFGLWLYTLMLPSLARSGWLADGFLQHGPAGLALLRPEQLFGLAGLDNLTHSLFWSLLANAALFVGVSLARRPGAQELAQAVLFVDVFSRTGAPAGPQAPLFWRGQARVHDLLALAGRFLGEARARALFMRHAAGQGVADLAALVPDAGLVHLVQTELAGAIGSASARVVVARAVQEEALAADDVLRIVEEATRLRAANQQLQSLDRLKDDFMSSVTHELRTPLTAIRGLAELMRDEPGMPEAQRQQFLGIVVDEAQRLSRLVNQVLDLAKIESGHARWLEEDVDLRALAQRSADAVAELLRERGVRLSLALPPDPLPPLVADPDRLMQVLVNLLSNAAKFAPAGRGQVRLALQADARGATFSVADDGPGVPAAERELVFEKFRQGSAGGGDPRVQGTGLGLPICREIVAHHGGRIWLEPDTGQGACFRFTLPWQRGAQAPPPPETRHAPQDPDRR
ncbi:sensor histidine kinase [Aquincola sp. J276]|uniref:sensor histidine kinase n=1 Tax=Aquincola sp. J276 TaxID=2898432 RepID=UPI0021511FF2|nr:sensor histidine kinase [Aquincola sp. J276]MCR5868726.1 sensor histidine kinase [Aquincola sp. J276]